MSAHCPKCGDYTEEDDARLCGRCATSNTNEAGPTPGPWRVWDSPKYGRNAGIAGGKGVDGAEKEIAMLNGGGDDDPRFTPSKQERAANARLIAAAPDLLAALDHARDLLRAYGMDEMPAIIDAALSRARGGK